MKPNKLIALILILTVVNAFGFARRPPASPTPTATARPSPTATATATATPVSTATKPIGLVYMIPSYKDSNRKPDWTAGNKNAHTQGVLIRETAALFDPNAVGDVDFATFLDPAIADAEAKGKFYGIELLSGSFMSPKFFENNPGHYLTLSDPKVGNCTVPWDSAFQQLWEKIETKLANKYDGRAGYAKVAGAGHSSESFFIPAQYPEDQAKADTLARSMGYPDSVTAWIAGMKWMIDMKLAHWHKTPAFLVTGQPFPNDAGAAALQEVFNYGFTKYPGRFFARADNLYENKPHSGEPSVKIQGDSFNASGIAAFQFGNKMQDVARMKSAMAIATGFPFITTIEVFPEDCDNATESQILDDTAVVLEGRRPK